MTNLRVFQFLLGRGEILLHINFLPEKLLVLTLQLFNSTLHAMNMGRRFSSLTHCSTPVIHDSHTVGHHYHSQIHAKTKNHVI